jgi:myo-inositol-1(or 4)-monophosphatase
MAVSEHRIEELSGFALEIVNRLGDKARTFSGRGESRLKFDQSLVTEAELQLTEAFTDGLRAAFPEHRIFPNLREDNAYTHEESRFMWIFDPLDGVANFQAGIPIWGISLALFENYWPLFGTFYMAATGDLFQGRAGETAYWNDRPIRTSAQESINDESLLLTYSRFHQRYRSTFPGKIRNLGCTAAHLCYVAAGWAEGAVIANESYQELAAASIIVTAAGGKIHKMDGGEFFLADYIHGDKEAEHLIALPPAILPQVRKHLHLA